MTRSLMCVACSLLVSVACGSSDAPAEDTPAVEAPPEVAAAPPPAPEPEAPPVALEKSADGTYSCTEGNYVIASIYSGPDDSPATGPLIHASGSCHLAVATSTIFGDPAIKVEGDAEVTSTRVSWNATEEGASPPISLEGNAKFTMERGSSHGRGADGPCAYVGAGTTLTINAGMCSTGMIANAGGTFTDNGGSNWHR